MTQKLCTWRIISRAYVSSIPPWSENVTAVLMSWLPRSVRTDLVQGFNAIFSVSHISRSIGLWKKDEPKQKSRLVLKSLPGKLALFFGSFIPISSVEWCGHKKTSFLNFFFTLSSEPVVFIVRMEWLSGKNSCKSCKMIRRNWNA